MVENSRSLKRRVSAQIGAGLSLALSSWLFVATGRWEWVLLVPAGAVAGLSIGAAMARYPSLAGFATSLAEAVRGAVGALGRWIGDRRLVVRFAALLTLSLLVFILFWSAAYALLPEGLLRGGSRVRMMGDVEAGRTIRAEWLSIWVRNLPWVAGIALVGLVVGYGYACAIPLVWTVFYALILGTNSFAFPMPERMAPSLDVMGRAGPYELAGFLLAAAASYPLSRVPLPWKETREGGEVHWREVAAALGLSAAGVLLAAWREAVMIAGL